MKKEIFAIAFLFILIAPVATMFIYLHFEKSAIKREIKWKMIAGMDHEELVLLKFSKEDTKTKLRWEHSKEFEYNGQMYDIVSKQIKGDSIYYRCWWDHEETALNKKLQKLVANAFDNDEDQQRNQKQLNLYFQTIFCSKPLVWHPRPAEVLLKLEQNMLHSTIFNSLHLSPPSPPPKVS